jgi:hypothetical protein
MTKFRDLAVGDTFDWVGPIYRFNTFFARCVKLSARTYTEVEGEGSPEPMRVGSINAEVFHVSAKVS